MKAAIEEEANVLCEALPRELEWLPKALMDRGCFKEEMLVYRDHTDKDWLTGETEHYAKVTCTGCGNSFLAQKWRAAGGCHNATPPAPFGYFDPQFAGEQVISGDCAVCPECQAKAKALHIGAFKQFHTVSTECCATVHAIRGHLVLLTWRVDRRTDKHGETFFCIHGDEGLAIIDQTPVRIVKSFNNMGSLCWLDEWQYRKCYKENIGEVYNERIFIDNGIEEQTGARNCALSQLIAGSNGVCFPSAYLATWCKYPNVENLVRQGIVNYLNYCLKHAYTTDYYGYTGHKNYRPENILTHLNVKKAKPHEIIGCDKTEIHLFRLLSPVAMEIFLLIEERGTRLKPEDAALLQTTNAEFSVWNELTKEPFHGYRVPVIRTLHYIAKQMDVCELASARELRDYWELLFRVEGRIDKDAAFPKNLVREHDRLNNLITEREQAEKRKELAEKLRVLNMKIGKIAKGLEDQCFFDEETGLCIRPCRSALELVEEGKALRHCVGSYRDKVARGETMIYFVRFAESPDRPYYTLELKDGTIVQDHGYQNKLQTTEILEFEKKWLKHIKNMKEKKNGKRNRSKTEQHSA